MKKSIHLSLFPIIYHCISCNQEYRTTSVSKQDIRIENCSNCNSFYAGTSASEIKVGAVEKYRQRVEKAKKFKNAAK